jgi:UDP-perosamine 4-acetyltransferase
MSALSFPPLPLILLGGGGHGRVLADLVTALGWSFYAVADPAPILDEDAFPGAEHWHRDEAIFAHLPDSVSLVNGIGGLPGAASRRRRATYDLFLARGYQFASLCHPSAVLGRRLTIADGVQVMAGAVVQGGCQLGFGVVVNSRASIDHDCRLGAHVTVSPGAVLCGGVVVGEGASLGAGCAVLQGVTIGAGALIGAGAVVRADVPAGGRVVAP